MNVVVYIHKGDSFYLNDIFQITRKNNPLQKIVLLGDNENKKYAELYNMEFHNISEYPVTNFHYKHYSMNSIPYEKFCYERWLVLFQFLQTTEYERVIYSDSDNAFFMDVNELLNHEESKKYNVLYLGNDAVTPNVFVADKNIYNHINNEIYNFFDQCDEVIEKIIETQKWYCGDKQTVHFSDMFILKYILDNSLNITKLNIENNDYTDFYLNGNYNSIKYNIEMKDKVPYYNNKKIFNLHFAQESKGDVTLFV
jgi:hypothetical protein